MEFYHVRKFLQLQYILHIYGDDSKSITSLDFVNSSRGSEIEFGQTISSQQW